MKTFYSFYGAGVTAEACYQASMVNQAGGLVGAPAVYSHGYGSVSKSWAILPQMFALPMVRSGFSLIIPDMSGLDHWGNPASRAAIDATKTALNAGGASGKIRILASSMGMLTALGYALEFPDRVEAIAGIVPCLDLNQAHGNATFTAAINAAYGGAYNNATHGLTSNPVVYADDLPSQDELPIAIWPSTTDELLPVASHADAFMAARPDTERHDIATNHANGNATASAAAIAWLSQFA